MSDSRSNDEPSISTNSVETETHRNESIYGSAQASTQTTGPGSSSNDSDEGKDAVKRSKRRKFAVNNTAARLVEEEFTLSDAEGLEANPSEEDFFSVGSTSSGILPPPPPNVSANVSQAEHVERENNTTEYLSRVAETLSNLSQHSYTSAADCEEEMLVNLLENVLNRSTDEKNE